MNRRDDQTLEERLRAALDVPLEDVRYGVDMSPQAITARLRDACEMSTLTLLLGAPAS